MTDLQTSTRFDTLQTWNKAFGAHIQSHYQGKTLKAIEQHVRVFTAWHEEQFSMAFDPYQLTEYALHLYRKHSLDVEKVKPATWNARLWALTILCGWSGNAQLTAGIEGKASMRRSTKHRSLTENERHRFVNALELNVQRARTDCERRDAIRNWTSASLMLQAGLRVEEVTLLDQADITIKERSGFIRVRNGKGSKERDVPLNLSARRALTAWQSELCANSTAEVLFEGDGKTGRITVRTLERIVTAIGEQAGIPDVTPHWLRYSFAKGCERNDTPIEDIADLLGHGDINITRRYLRSSLADLQSAVEE